MVANSSHMGVSSDDNLKVIGELQHTKRWSRRMGIAKAGPEVRKLFPC